MSEYRILNGYKRNETYEMKLCMNLIDHISHRLNKFGCEEKHTKSL